MKVTYTGRQEPLQAQLAKKVDTRFAKLGRLLDRRGEKEAHVILTAERHLHKAEITIRCYGHDVVGIATETDQFNALTTATDRLEKQLQKLRAKQRDTKRGPAPRASSAAAETAPPASGRVFRVNHHQSRKPMTLDEALLEVGKDGDYCVYRDAETDRVSVLLKRSDGNFDLIES